MLYVVCILHCTDPDTHPLPVGLCACRSFGANHSSGNQPSYHRRRSTGLVVVVVVVVPAKPPIRTVLYCNNPVNKVSTVSSTALLRNTKVIIPDR